jgi:hypothetical protein
VDTFFSKTSTLRTENQNQEVYCRLVLVYCLPSSIWQERIATYLQYAHPNEAATRSPQLLNRSSVSRRQRDFFFYGLLFQRNRNRDQEAQTETNRTVSRMDDYDRYQYEAPPPQEGTTTPIGTSQFDQVFQICFCALFVVAFWYVLRRFV